MNPAIVVAIIGSLGALILAWRGLRWKSLPPGRGVKLIAIWVAIFVIVMIVIASLDIEVQR